MENETAVKNAVMEIMDSIIVYCKSEGDAIRKQFGREPTQEEAERIVAQAKRMVLTARAASGY